MIYLTYGQELDADYARWVNEVGEYDSCVAQVGR
jgi:hypothetical protein